LKLQPYGKGPIEAHTRVNSRDCLNFVSNGVLGLQNHPEVKRAAIETAREFGVGSCGPRGFYGSLQPHLDFETDIAKFMGKFVCG
jgi:serine palmitoyltransferase